MYAANDGTPIYTTREAPVSDMDEALGELRSVNDLVRWGVSRFNEAALYFGHGTDNAVDEALNLVLHALHLPHGLPAELLVARVTRSERQAALALLQERVEKRIPAAYLTHEAWFAGLKFYVDPRVLIPRSPLAELVEKGFAPWVSADRITRVLDLCTGSGCIAVACALAFPAAEVDAVDVSADALEVARINAERHQVAGQVQLFASDLFAAVNDRRYDIIVSNPPYVGAEELASLPVEYRHEPELGLAAGSDGLEVVTRILREAGALLNPGGILVVEVGNSEEALVERFADVPFTWLEFERGGGGVFLLSAEELERHTGDFVW